MLRALAVTRGALVAVGISAHDVARTVVSGPNRGSSS